MLVKINANQISLPKSVTEAVAAADYFDVVALNGQIILTPLNITQSEVIRLKLAEQNIQEQDIENAMEWARQNIDKNPQ